MHRKAFWTKLIYNVNSTVYLAHLINWAEFILEGKDTVPSFDSQHMSGHFLWSYFHEAQVWITNLFALEGNVWIVENVIRVDRALV